MRASFRVFVLGFVATSFATAAEFDAAAATNRVGLEVFRSVRTSAVSASAVVSPYSIESALTLAYAGARGDTRAELGRVLAVPDDDAAIQRGFTGLRIALDQAADASVRAVEKLRRSGESVETIHWRVANRLYGQDGYPFRPEFLALMRDGYQAPFTPLDFKHAPEQSRATINDWVAETTSQRITQLIPDGGVTPDARLVLVNALYLKAPWKDPFFAEQTHPVAFELSEFKAVKVPMMHQTRSFDYIDTGRAQVVALPFQGDELQFVVALPKAGVPLDDMVAELTPEAVRSWTQLKPRRGKVNLWLPKLRLEPAPLELSTAFRQLGVRRAFDDPKRSANFDGIAPRTPDDYLYLSKIYHRTFVAVDEQGTEASAATAVMMLNTFGVSNDRPVDIRVDHPFVFAIQERRTGVCLFLGQVLDPR